jgi:hypothetical protein
MQNANILPNFQEITLDALHPVKEKKDCQYGVCALSFEKKSRNLKLIFKVGVL